MTTLRFSVYVTLIVNDQEIAMLPDASKKTETHVWKYKEPCLRETNNFA